MLFKDIWENKFQKFSPLFDKLFDLVIENQTHSGDLLLVMENAVLSDEEDVSNPGQRKLYYNIGPGLDYHCETTNYEFIGQYVKGLLDIKYDEYLKLHKFTSERSKEINQVVKEESITIQIEMLVYLKIWEGEAFLKKWYQISRLINGENYDWHCKIKTKKGIEAGGFERYELLRKIKENLKDKIPALEECFAQNHQSQLRNAIAHSQYATVGRNIFLNNYDKNKIAHEPTISFDTWVDIFHETIVLFTLYDIFFDKVKNYYYNLTLPFKLKKEVRVTRIYPVSSSYLIVLYSREFYKDWSPYPNP